MAIYRIYRKPDGVYSVRAELTVGEGKTFVAKSSGKGKVGLMEAVKDVKASVDSRRNGQATV